MFVGNKSPTDPVVDFATISIHIKLGVFLKLSLATEAIYAHCNVPVARRVTAVVIFAQGNVPVLEGFYPVLSMGYTVPFAFDGRVPVDREQILKSCVSARPCLLDEQMKWQDTIDDL